MPSTTANASETPSTRLICVPKTRREYQQTLKRLKTLLRMDPPDGSPENNELEVLLLLVKDYEDRAVPSPDPDPIEYILFRMEQLKKTRRDLIPYIGSESKVSEVLARKRPLSLAMIRRLNEGLGIPAEVLIKPIQLRKKSA